MKSLVLNAETSMPILGFGTWQLSGEICHGAVKKALEIGYRHIDTAEMYANEEEVGRAISESKIARNEIFLTSKVWHANLRRADLFESFEESLKTLKTDYLDLYLIHWPNREIPVSETLSAMNELKDKGRIKALGVANFTIRRLEEALKTEIEITNNQVEFHPTLNQKELKEFCVQEGITMTAYSPLGRGAELKNPAVLEIAQKRGRSPAQVLINWLLGQNIAAIPRSKDPGHIEDNFKAVEWGLNEEDMAKLGKIGGKERVANPPHAEFDE